LQTLNLIKIRFQKRVWSHTKTNVLPFYLAKFFSERET